jgi:UDP-N-acetylmuramyl pentapeptide phosphotransferase/UDP-N-acetylglucosamine-1-phosphate transferase
MVQEIKNTAIGVKRMGVILWCVAAICVIVWMAKPATGAVPTPIVLAALTIVGTLGGIDRWRQIKDV